MCKPRLYDRKYTYTRMKEWKASCVRLTVPRTPYAVCVAPTHPRHTLHHRRPTNTVTGEPERAAATALEPSSSYGFRLLCTSQQKSCPIIRGEVREYIGTCTPTPRSIAITLTAGHTAPGYLHLRYLCTIPGPTLCVVTATVHVDAAVR